MCLLYYPVRATWGRSWEGAAYLAFHDLYACHGEAAWFLLCSAWLPAALFLIYRLGIPLRVKGWHLCPLGCPLILSFLESS